MPGAVLVSSSAALHGSDHPSILISSCGHLWPAAPRSARFSASDVAANSYGCSSLAHDVDEHEGAEAGVCPSFSSIPCLLISHSAMRWRLSSCAWHHVDAGRGWMTLFPKTLKALARLACISIGLAVATALSCMSIISVSSSGSIAELRPSCFLACASLISLWYYCHARLCACTNQLACACLADAHLTTLCWHCSTCTNI